MAYKPVAGPQMAAPNVIPMADIMLVLLIIFMVVTPMLQKTHQVDLAPTNNPQDMKNAVKDGISNRLDKTVYVKSDARAKYGRVVEIVDEIRSAGVDQLGLLTEKNQNLKQAQPSPNQQQNVELENKTVVVQIANNGKLKINQEETTWDRLGPRMEEIFKERAEKIAFVKGDNDVMFKDVARAIDIMRGAGIDKIGLITAKLEAGQ